MGNTSRFRPSAGVVLQILLKHCSLPARANSSMEKDASGCKFWAKNLKTMSANKASPKGFGVLHCFSMGGGLGFFVCLWLCFSQVFLMLIYESTLTAISVLMLPWTTYFLVANSVVARLKSAKVQNMDVSAFHKKSFVALGHIKVYIK